VSLANESDRLLALLQVEALLRAERQHELVLGAEGPMAAAHDAAHGSIYQACQAYLAKAAE
jgi:hypothetical protein